MLDCTCQFSTQFLTTPIVVSYFSEPEDIEPAVEQNSVPIEDVQSTSRVCIANTQSTRGRKRQRRSTTRSRRVAQTHVGDGCENSYSTPDTGNHLPAFSPSRQPGLHLNVPVLRTTMLTAVEFFRLFFSLDLIKQIVSHTNAYAWNKICEKQHYAQSDGSWRETCPNEIEKLIALIIYFGLVNVSTTHRFWSVKTLYHGLWARKILSRERYKALMAVLHIVDPNAEDPSDKLRKVSSFVALFKEKCKSLYQPFQQIAIDERMVKSKHRSGIRQYIKNKPTKWGLKLWVLADSANGYTWDFNVYIGRAAGREVSEYGLGYDVVMKLIDPLLDQGYQLFVDNFYTSPILLKNLFLRQTPATGTITENRKGFPTKMKGGKSWAKGKERGAMRWERTEECLVMQWKDNRVVTLLTTIDNANETVTVTRKSKGENGRWIVDNNVKQPKGIERYNKFMNGVDRSDQALAKNSVLRKSMKWWKTLFYHMIDMALVNGHILFKLHRAANPEAYASKIPAKYSLLEFKEDVVRQLAGLEEYGEPPCYKHAPKDKPDFQADHMPVFSDSRHTCRVCYDIEKVQRKVFSYCDAPQCKVYLHCTVQKNCFQEWHKKDYPYRK